MSTYEGRGMILRTGLHKEMEDAANELLRRDLAGVTKHSDKSDILTPWKEQARRSREVYPSSGVPDGALRRGNFHRSANVAYPHLNSTEAIAPPKMGRNGSSWDSE